MAEFISEIPWSDLWRFLIHTLSIYVIIGMSIYILSSGDMIMEPLLRIIVFFISGGIAAIVVQSDVGHGRSHFSE